MLYHLSMNKKINWKDCWKIVRRRKYDLENAMPNWQLQVGYFHIVKSWLFSFADAISVYLV